MLVRTGPFSGPAVRQRTIRGRWHGPPIGLPSGRLFLRRISVIRSEGHFATEIRCAGGKTSPSKHATRAAVIAARGLSWLAGAEHRPIRGLFEAKRAPQNRPWLCGRSASLDSLRLRARRSVSRLALKAAFGCKKGSSGGRNDGKSVAEGWDKRERKGARVDFSGWFVVQSHLPFDRGSTGEEKSRWVATDKQEDTVSCNESNEQCR